MIVNQIIKTFDLALEETGYKWQTPTFIEASQGMEPRCSRGVILYGLGSMLPALRGPVDEMPGRSLGIGPVGFKASLCRGTSWHN